jgi:ribosome-binding protein aMBF1 (putative translation factor)
MKPKQLNPVFQPLPRPLPSSEELAAGIAEMQQLPTHSIITAENTAAVDAEAWTSDDLQQALEAGLLERRVGAIFRQAREHRGLSGAELARRIGVSTMRVSQLERVGADVEVQTLNRLAQALGYRLTLSLAPIEGGENLEIAIGS